ncbi:MAG: COX15/CtaA family protein [Deltaproteobacteria bacterium]|nr:COX15/CtaA family protein [Deltaproteobacteria bacterium]
MDRTTFTQYATGCVGYNLAVIAWGAYVRATGSGAGCGRHWPLCNGELVPRARDTAQVIELSHRVSSGLALLLGVGLYLGARRALPPRHPARRAAAGALGLLGVEALLGAGLVLLRLVASNASTARGWYLAAHLTNTFLLLACLSLTAWWSRLPERRPTMPSKALRVALGVTFLAVLSVAVSGGIAALGDTLFRVRSVAEGLAQDRSASAHVFLRLRVFHPLLAVGSALWVVFFASAVRHALRRPPITALSRGLTALVLTQVGLGVLNVVLLAPVWLQLVHLVLADLVWVTLVLLAAAAVEGPVEA